ncbi:MAG: hypothetical protein IT191_01025 [Microbacteriaceae bacterium]|nr:hypothetical protein [Cryobacterium sp.]MBX3104354.1 hypothetical protein [Cryobacterium sp.]MCC6375581.1 hypothetical protein [Microbacteriaceae bacterium]
MSNEDISDPGHGNSPAAWIAVVIMLIGFVTAVVAFWVASPTLFFVSVGIIVLGPIVGWILAKAGWGVAGPRFQPKSHN